MPIHYHSNRAITERLVAGRSSNAEEAAIHLTLAEMHEQMAAGRVNRVLAPFEHSRAWEIFAR
jgi:hypothetical protein